MSDCRRPKFGTRHARHHAELQRHPLGGAQGPVRLARAAEGRLPLPAGDQGATGRPRGRARGVPAEGLARPLQQRAKKRLRRRRAVRAQQTRRRARQARRRRVRRRGPLPRGAPRQPFGRLAVRAVRLGGPRAAGLEGPLPGFLPAAPARMGRQRPRLRDLRRLEHRASRDRPEELARQPQELRLPAARARLARPGARQRRVGGRLPTPASRRGRAVVHLVEQPRRGVGQERRLAHRLPGGQRRPARTPEARRDLQGQALLRPRAADAGLRAVISRVRAWLEPYRAPRVAAMVFLGFSAGLPFLLVFQTLTAWLAQAGIERGKIGLISLIGLTYSIKVFWAPVVDRLPLPLLTRVLGRRRSWMLLAQFGLIAGLTGMALGDPAVDLQATILCALLVAFSSATQDITIDAWRIEAAPAESQGAMAAAYQLGYRFGLIAAGTGALVLAGETNWHASYLAMAALVGVGIATTLLIP